MDTIEFPHEWDDEDDPRICDACSATYMDSGHFPRTNEECPAVLRSELDYYRDRCNKLDIE